jgi:hypothetical protein
MTAHKSGGHTAEETHLRQAFENQQTMIQELVNQVKQLKDSEGATIAQLRQQINQLKDSEPDTITELRREIHELRNTEPDDVKHLREELQRLKQTHPATIQKLQDEITELQKRESKVTFKTLTTVAKPKPYKSGSDFELFVNMFENYCQGSEIKEDEKNFQLLSLLDEEAYKHYIHLGLHSSISYHELLRALKSKFQPLGQEQAARRQLKERKQQEGESLEKFLDALTDLVRKSAFHDNPDERICEAFEAGIRNSKIRRAVIEHRIKTPQENIPTDLLQVANQAEVVEIVMSSSEFSSASEPPVCLASDMQNTQNQNTFDKKQNTKTIFRPISRNEPREPPKCFRCHKPGHFARDCQQEEIPSSNIHKTCYICGRPNHLARTCYFRFQGNRTRNAAEGAGNVPRSRSEKP